MINQLTNYTPNTQTHFHISTTTDASAGKTRSGFEKWHIVNFTCKGVCAHVVNGDSVELNLYWVCSICFGSRSNRAVQSHAWISHIPSALYAQLCAHYFHLQNCSHGKAFPKIERGSESLSRKHKMIMFSPLWIFLTVTNHLFVTPAFSKSAWAPLISILISLGNLAKANLFCYPPPIRFPLFLLL